jgi:hypothetical protein
VTLGVTTIRTFSKVSFILLVCVFEGNFERLFFIVYIFPQGVSLWKKEREDDKQKRSIINDSKNTKQQMHDTRTSIVLNTDNNMIIYNEEDERIDTSEEELQAQKEDTLTVIRTL